MSAVEQIAEQARKRLAEIEAEAATLRAIIQAAGGALPALPAQFMPVPCPMPAYPIAPFDPSLPFGPVITFVTGAAHTDDCAGTMLRHTAGAWQ